MGQTKLLDDLLEDLARGDVLVVAGTGVSIQATGKQACAEWVGLIESGIQHCVGTNLLTEPEADALRRDLAENDLEKRLVVAETISAKLEAPDGGEFRRWLAESVGELTLKDRAIIDAIHGLGAPIATTNYDDLLRRARGIEHVPWTDGPAAHEIVRGGRRGILHFHGCHDHPASVVLGIRSYQKLLDSSGAQAIQQAVVADRTLLFVGCGDGLSDPNFGALLEWTASNFGGSIYRHYCLCRSSEREALQRAHPPSERLFYIEYGDDFSDLVPFLRKLARVAPSTALPPAGHCFGREREVGEVVAALLAPHSKPLPILGGPGMGKTTIALTALHERRVAERFGARRMFIRCDGVKTRIELAAAIARPLDIPITPSVEQAVLAELAKEPTALVLDNAETPLDADRVQIEELLSVLATIDSLALVVTIRGHKRPRNVPWMTTTEAERLSADAARETFVAAAGKDHFADDPDLPRLLGVLDGVPLAITLMGRFAEIFDSLEPVWTRWQKKRTAMLKDGEGRLNDIEVSYELSIEVLSERAKRLLSVLAMLPDGVADIDLAAIFEDPDDAADELRRRALVVEEGNRMRMLAPLREYVMAAYAADAEDAGRVVGHYLELAANEGRKVGREGGAEAVRRLALEVGNVEAMFTLSVHESDKRVDMAIHGWGELMRFAGLGSMNPLERIAAQALAASMTRRAAVSTSTLGRIALARSMYETARERFEQALSFCRMDGNALEEVYCIEALGEVALTLSDYDAAKEHYEKALPLYQQVGSAVGEANCLVSIGDIAYRRADDDFGRPNYEKALLLYKTMGSLLGQANCIKSLGHVAFQQSDVETARKRYEEALPLYREIGDVVGIANCIRSVGEIARIAGDKELAKSHYREALGLFEQITDLYSSGATHCLLARIATDASRTFHLNAAREAWKSIQRDDLIAQLDAEFGGEN